MNHDDILRLTALNLADKSQQQIWLDALETLGNEAAEAINAGDFERAIVKLETANQVIVFPRQFPAFKNAVQQFGNLWSTLVEAEEIFNRFNELAANFAIAVDPTDELNNENTKDDEQQPQQPA